MLLYIKTKFDVNRRLKLVKTGKRSIESFSCEFCDNLFAAKQTLERHQQSCGALINHNLISIEKSETLPKSGPEMKKIFAQGQKSKTLLPFSCALCDQQFWTIENIDQHFTSNHYITCSIRRRFLTTKSKNH